MCQTQTIKSMNKENREWKGNIKANGSIYHTLYRAETCTVHAFKI